MFGAVTVVVDTRQRDPAHRFTPEVCVVAKIQLLEFNHQPTQVHAAEARALTEHPVVIQEFSDQRRPLHRKILLVAGLGIKTRDDIISSDKQRRLRAEVLAQTVFRQVTGLLAQHPIHDAGQRLTTQNLTRLRHQLFIELISKRLLEQAREVTVQPVLHRGVAGVTPGPFAGDPLLEPGRVTAILCTEHQICTQTVEQTIAIFHVGANLPFQLCRDPWQ